MNGTPTGSSGSSTREAVLLMAYGAPAGEADLAGYLKEVLEGRSPPPGMVEEYRRRYARIGGSPQMRIVESLRAKLEVRLASERPGVAVLLGTKHWAPHVAEVLQEAARRGIEKVVAIPLSPYAAPWILRPYSAAIDDGIARAGGGLKVELRAGWQDRAPLIGYWAQAIRRALDRLHDPAAVTLLTAHSLPERRRKEGDPYPELVHRMAEAVARAAGLERWEFAYQSAGNTTEPWLGPDVTERMADWKRRGHPTQLIAPIGFLFDHLEVLWDLDIVVAGFAAEHGIAYHRVPMANDDPRVVEALCEVALAPPASSAPSPD